MNTLVKPREHFTKTFRTCKEALGDGNLDLCVLTLRQTFICEEGLAAHLARLILQMNGKRILPRPADMLEALLEVDENFYEVFLKVVGSDKISKKEVEDKLASVAKKILSLEREIEDSKEMGENLRQRLLTKILHGAKTEYLYGCKCLEDSNLFGAALQARYSACLLAVIITHPKWRKRPWRNFADDLKKYDPDFFKEYLIIHDAEKISTHRLQSFLKDIEKAAYEIGIRL